MAKRLRYESSPGNTTLNIDDLAHTICKNVSTNPRALGALSRLNKASNADLKQPLEGLNNTVAYRRVFTDPTIMHNIASHFIGDELIDEFALPRTDLVPFEDQVQGEFTRLLGREKERSRSPLQTFFCTQRV